MKSMKQDTWLTLLSRIPIMALSFMSMTILTRWLGPEGNGVYTYIFANINLLLLLLGLQTETAVIHYLAQPDADEKAESTLALIAAGASSLLCAIVLYLAGILIPSFRLILVPEGQPYGFFLWFVILSFLFRKSLNTFLAMQRATLQFKSYNLLQLISQIIPALLYLYGFFFLFHADQATDIIPVFRFILAGQGGMAIAGLVMVMSAKKTGLSFQFKNRIKPFFTYSFKSTLDAIAKFVNRRIDIYFIQAFNGLAPLGQYGLASQISNFAQEIIHPFTQVMNPYLVKSDPHGRMEITARMARIIVTLTSVLSLGIILTAPWVIPFLFGKAFTPSVAATQILALSVVISTLRIIFASYFQSVNQLHVNIRSNWLGVLVTIVLDILLIPRFGITGAAVASILAYAFSMGYLFIHIRRETNIAVRDFLLIRRSDVDWLFKKGG